MKKIFLLLPTVIMVLLSQLSISCSDKDDGEKEVPIQLEDVFCRTWTTLVDDNSSSVKRTYVFRANKEGVICDWCDGQWEAYDFTYVIDGQKKEVSITSGTYPSKNVTLELSQPFIGKDGRLRMDCVEHLDGNSNAITLVDDNVSYVYPKYEFTYKEGDAINAKVLANPQKYGFNSQKAMMLHIYRNKDNGETDYLKQIEIWKNGKGFFIIGNSTTDNIYRAWNKYDTFYYAPGGILNLNNGMEWNVGALTTEYYDVVVNAEKVEIDNARIIDSSPHKLNSLASSYNQALGIYMSSTFYFDVWYDNFSWSDISVYTDASWLWIAEKKTIFSKKGDKVPDRPGKYYDYTSGAFYFGTSENSGTERTGHIYVSIKTPQGKTYNSTITVIQQGKYSGGGGNTGGGNTGGGSSGGGTSEYQLYKSGATAKVLTMVSGKITDIDYKSVDIYKKGSNYYVKFGTYVYSILTKNNSSTFCGVSVSGYNYFVIKLTNSSSVKYYYYVKI